MISNNKQKNLHQINEVLARMQRFSREINKPPHEKQRKLIQKARDLFLKKIREQEAEPEYLAVHGSAWYSQKKNSSLKPNDVDLIVFSKMPKELDWPRIEEKKITVDTTFFYTPQATKVEHQDFADLLSSLHLGKIIAKDLKQYTAFSKKRRELIALMKEKLGTADEKQVKNVLKQLEEQFKGIQEHVAEKTKISTY